MAKFDELDQLRIAKPCPATWEHMHGNDQVRHCTHCKKNVYNLTAMSREEAKALIEDREGSICVRMYQRADGKVMTSNCPKPLRRFRATRTLWGLVFSVGIFGCAKALSAPGGYETGEAPASLGQLLPDIADKIGRGIGDAVTKSMSPPEPMILGKIALPPKPDSKKNRS